MTKTARTTLALLVLGYAGILTQAQAKNVHPKSAPTSHNLYTPAQWREDIGFLMQRLEIIHPNPYANAGKAKFTAFANELRKKAATASDTDMYVGMMELVKLVKDGHTSVSWGEKQFGRLLHLCPFQAYMFSDGLFVTSAIKKYSAMVGQKIVKVGTVATDEFMRRRARIKTGENQWGELNSIDFFIEELRYLDIVDRTDALPLTLEDQNGARHDVAVTPVPMREYWPLMHKKVLPLQDDQNVTMNGSCPNPAPLWLSRLAAEGTAGDPYWFTYLPDREAIYLQINLCYNKKDDPFEMFFARMFKTLDEKGAKRLIIDVRLNDGGDHFERPLLLGVIARPALNKADRLFLITGRRTFSAAQHLVMGLTRYTNITTFGEPTGARPNYYGSHNEFDLPNSTICICLSGKFWQDAGPNDFRTITEPDFFVPLASADYRDNRDPVLQRIFDFDTYNNLRPTFLQNMSKAYAAGGIPGMQRELAAMKPQLAHFGFNLEKLLYEYTDLDDWMSKNAKNDDEYVSYLRFLRQELPESINVCWGLTWYLSKPQDREEKKSLYRKCLELNPEHNQARMRLRLMEMEDTRHARRPNM
jgi:hypothetical protein